MTSGDLVRRIQATARARHVTGRVVTAVTVIVAAVSLVLIGAALIDAVRAIPEIVRLEKAYAAGDIPWQQYLLSAQYQNLVELFVLLYLGLYVLPFIVALPVAAAIVMLWREPARILVLRPFNRRPLTRGLARLVRRDVARYGHVYTLADAELRVRWYVRVPLLLGQLALLSFRARTIRKPRQLDRLERAIRRTWLRNINWCLSWSKIFPVATDDGHWKEMVERLVTRSSLVLIDLTEARANVLWEIGLIDRLGLSHRVIWLVRAGDAVPSLSGGSAVLEPERVHTYGLHAREGAPIRAAIAESLAGERRARGAGAWRGQAISIAALIMFVTGTLPLLVLWSGAMSERLSRPDYTDVNIGLAIVVYGAMTLLALVAASLTNRNAVFFIVVQVVLLTGAVIG